MGIKMVNKKNNYLIQRNTVKKELWGRKTDTDLENKQQNRSRLFCNSNNINFNGLNTTINMQISTEWIKNYPKMCIQWIYLIF